MHHVLMRPAGKELTKLHPDRTTTIIGFQPGSRYSDLYTVCKTIRWKIHTQASNAPNKSTLRKSTGILRLY